MGNGIVTRGINAIRGEFKEDGDIWQGLGYFVLFLMAIYLSVFQLIPDAGGFGSFIGGTLGVLVNGTMALCVWRTYNRQSRNDDREQWKKEILMLTDAISERARSALMESLVNKVCGGYDAPQDTRSDKSQKFNLDASYYEYGKNMWHELMKPDSDRQGECKTLENHAELFFLLVSKLECASDEDKKIYLTIWITRLSSDVFIFLSAWGEIKKRGSEANKILRKYLDIKDMDIQPTGDYTLPKGTM